MRDGHGNRLTPDQENEIKAGVRGTREAGDKDASSDLVSEVARKHGVGVDAVQAALVALRHGGGTMAQFSHQDFGGMAQWSAGGMSMVGDMFNSATKAKLDGVLQDLANALRRGELPEAEPAEAELGHRSPGSWSSEWPAEFGQPSATGSQNDMRYAFFPASHRLIVDDGRNRKVYDTGKHVIEGVSQQQRTGRTLTFQSQLGPVDVADLPSAE